VTELAFGLDLVAWQLRIAQGEPLTLRQEDLRSRGHAIEARVYAEDPVTFLPTGGRLLDVRLPGAGRRVRIDHALAPGRDVSIAYDPLLAKVIGSGETREQARLALLDALAGLALPGVVSNVPLLQHALELPDFVGVTHTVETLERSPLPEAGLDPPASVVRAARRQQLAPRSGQDPFSGLPGWRGGATDTATWATDTEAGVDAGRVLVTPAGDRVWVTLDGRSYELPRDTIERGAHHGAAGADSGDRSELTAPMPGTVIKTLEAGSSVRAGEAVVVLEAMKMENALLAPFDGVVEHVGCAAGDLVPKGAVLAAIVRDSAAELESPVPAEVAK
jgi:acetyl/propionyl-CoA carboxylase alpha subunit